MSLERDVAAAGVGQGASLYAEGLKQLQLGQWEEAIRCLEAAAREQPGTASAGIAAALGEARFKAQLDARSRVRARRWIIPWRSLLVRAGLAVALVAATIVAVQVIQRRVAPEVQAAQAAQQLSSTVAKGKGYLDADNFAAAREAFQRALDMDPGNEEAANGLNQVAQREAWEKLYQEGVAAQEGGQPQVALEKFTAILQESSGYKDVVVRIRDIRQRGDEDALFNRAEAEYQADRCEPAIEAYRQLQALNAGYRRDYVAGRLFDCYVRLARQIIDQRPPDVSRVPQAKEYLTQALALRPNDTEAATEERLATVYLAGRAAFEARNWDEAIRRFDALHQQRPGYLGNVYLAPLYDAYIASGDAYAAAEQYADAWNQYNKAAGLPVEDRVVADERRARIASRITPTPTPTSTPTATLIPTPTAYIPPTARPSATPLPPLASFRNQIVFKADKAEESGFWVMNPDGSNRRYLGMSKTLEQQYDELLQRDMRSPDGRCRVYTIKDQNEKFAQIYTQCPGNAPSEVWTTQLTHLAGTTYDPVWAPDGSRIAFVSQDRGSDDVWVVNPDGTGLWNYTLNVWEWDKHPSWSPDSRKIVFWSNREGTKQIFVMDADGRNLKKIFATTWDEYDPIWVK